MQEDLAVHKGMVTLLLSHLGWISSTLGFLWGLRPMYWLSFKFPFYSVEFLYLV